jgi:hypothetical protein
VRAAVLAAICLAWTASATAQTFEQRGFVEGRGTLFPQTAPQDTKQSIADLLARDEVFWTPADWFRAEAGIDLRANSHGQVESDWRLDFDDRTARRPRLSLRRAAVTLENDRLALTAGKQFIRWGRTDVLNPTDRFAPRDYLTVLDNDFLAVTGVRPSVRFGGETFEAVLLPRMTPSRMPLLDKRWVVAPPSAAGVPLVDGGSVVPGRAEYGARWAHTGSRVDLALSFFDGFNDLPTISGVYVPERQVIEVTRTYPAIRTYGVDFALPTTWFLLKGEAVRFDSPADVTDEYALFVLEAERQVGEWLLVGGYAGEAVIASREAFVFAPDRGIARSLLGRAAYTVDPRRTVAIEGAVREQGTGGFVRGEYSQTFAGRWRLTLAGVGVGGEADDFLGQFRRNSNVSLALRVSF